MASSPTLVRIPHFLGTRLFRVLLAPIWLPVALAGMFASFVKEMFLRGWYAGKELVAWMDDD